MDSNQKRSQALKIYWHKASERKSQLSNRMRGENNPAKLTIVRKRISENKLGKYFRHTRPLSMKQKLHLSRLAEIKRGKKLSLESRLKISLSRKGKCRGVENPFYGKHHTKAVIQKLKTAHKFHHAIRFQEILQITKSLGFEIDSCLKQARIDDSLHLDNKINPLGYIIGTIPTDAYFGKSKKKDSYVYSIAVKDIDFIENVADCFKRIYGFKPNLNRQRNLFRIQTCKRQIEEFLRFLKKENYEQWIFSNNIFNLEQDFLKSVLMAVSDAEGCVTNSTSNGNIISRKITITNTSLALLRQIKLLLKLFEIQSYIYSHRQQNRIVKIRKNTCQFKKAIFTLIITGKENLEKFKNTIGFSIRRKQCKLKNILASYKKFDRHYKQDEYNLVLKLSKYFSNCGDISRLTNIPPHTVRNWVLYNRKPRAEKMIQSI